MRYRELLMVLTIGMFAFSGTSRAEGTEALAPVAFGGLTADFGPAAMALGGAPLSRSTGLTEALLSSPVAMLNGQTGFGGGLGYGLWMPKYGPDNKMNASVAFNNSKFAVGLNAAYRMSPSYPVYNEAGTHVGDFSPNGLRIAAGAALKLGNIFSLGLDLKYLRDSEAKNAALNGFAAGLHAGAVFGGLSASIGVRDLGPKVKSQGGESFALPSSVAASVSYGLNFGENTSLNLDAAAFCYLSGGVSAAAGAELGFAKYFVARAGYRYSYPSSLCPSFASAGLGFRIKGFSLDASYLFASRTLSNTMLFGVSYAF